MATLALFGGRLNSVSQSRPARILLVEDEALFRELLIGAFAGQTAVQVVAVAEEGETAIQLARETRPDAVIMDIQLSGEMDGIKAALQIKRERPETGIVVLSAHKDRRYVTSLPLEDGAGWAYLLKQSVPDVATLVHAIQGSSNGMLVLDAAIIASLRPSEGSLLDKLPSRQLQILQLIAQGFNNASIAVELGLAEKTIEVYINIMYQALNLSHVPGINARVQATLLYLQESEDR